MKPTAKLTEYQRTALVETIKLWELKRDGLLPIDGEDNCALCWKFKRRGAYGCQGCPVFQETGERFCVGTPFLSACSEARESDPFYHDFSRRVFLGPVVSNDAARAAAQREVTFLKRILKRRG